jgi:ketosteroid isomerase-like protein
MDPGDRLRIQKIIEQRLASFEAAERALDAAALLDHFSDEPGLYMYNDGQRVAFATIATGLTTTFPTLRALDGGFDDPDVHVLAADAALVTALFHETITAQDGSVVSQRGAATWLWRLRHGEWKITYGHIDHYPDPGNAH